MLTTPSPTGTVTFLFTDIEASTKLWEKFPGAMKPALAQHDAILRSAVEGHHGQIIKTTGDGVHACFTTSLDAVNAVLDAQRQFQAPLGELTLKVRMGIHTGEAELRAGDYYGPALNRAARLMSAAYGGQILVSNATAELLRDQLPRQVVLRDLGEQRLKDLSRPEHIFQLEHPGLPDEFPPLKSIDSFPNNLPIQLTSFVGREKEIAEIQALLSTSRLVTLTGSGGTGKTRLALEVGAQELGSYANGAWLVELAPLSDPAQIIPALAQAFGLEELPFTPLMNTVTDYLRDKQLLLIMDNCEHLIDACARLANDLLHQCVRLKILASSREGLGIAGEMTYRIPSLGSAEAAQLFVERARAANLNFNPAGINASAVAKICTRLDGIPLAIELAAARARLLSPEQIAARLDDRFRLLVGGSRTALPRQQTLRAMIDWSYDLLSEEERQLLRTASVFAGGWSLEALEAVAEDPNLLEHLEQLVNKSMVMTEEYESEMRYFMLETIRQYAREKLFDAQQAPAVRDRHFAYFNQLSESFWKAYLSEDLISWASRSNHEVDNFRAALEWGIENHVDETVRLAANFGLICSMVGIFAEGLAVAKTTVERVMALPPLEGEAQVNRQRLIARALFMQGMVGLGVGNMPQVIRDLQKAIAISRQSGDQQMLGYSLEMYFTAASFLNLPDRAEAAQEGFQIFTTQVNDRFGLGLAYLNMARLAAERGAEAEKEAFFAKLRERIVEVPGTFVVGFFYLGMGMDEAARGHHAAAIKHFEDGLVIFKGTGSTNFQLVLQSEMGHTERRMGNWARAESIYRETLRGWLELGHRSAVAHQLECLGFLAVAQEEPQRAIKLFASAQALREKIPAPMLDHERVEYDQFTGQLRAMLTEAEFNALWSEGRAMLMEQAVQLALN